MLLIVESSRESIDYEFTDRGVVKLALQITFEGPIVGFV